MFIRSSWCGNGRTHNVLLRDSNQQEKAGPRDRLDQGVLLQSREYTTDASILKENLGIDT